MEQILNIQNLRTYYFTEYGVVKAIDGIDLIAKKGTSVGIMGESGCGKSTLALTILKLLPPSARITFGNILFNGIDLVPQDENFMRKIRGNEISIVFQNPATSLDPTFTIGDQIGEVITLHQNLDEEACSKEVINILSLTGFPDPSHEVSKYPHELSGGMKQRALIAMALSCRPQFVICDEPTSSLDVSIQAQILHLIHRMTKELRTTLLLISHNPGVIAETCDEVGVMYAGKIVEYADIHSIFDNPTHPYTQGLIQSIPQMEGFMKKFESIPGEAPNLLNPPTGCRFHPRCPMAKDICVKKDPVAVEVNTGHRVYCHDVSKR